MTVSGLNHVIQTEGAKTYRAAHVVWITTPRNLIPSLLCAMWVLVALTVSSLRVPSGTLFMWHANVLRDEIIRKSSQRPCQ